MIAQNAVLLAVMAHPDDETFGVGGTLALYARRGVDVHLVCATRGEAGQVEVEALEKHGSVANLRESELQCAAKVLGLTGVHFLDYRDSGMPGSPDNLHPRALMQAPVATVAGEVADYMRSLKPRVMITFDPIGGYNHPDHVAIHRATVMAFDMTTSSSDANDRSTQAARLLYYHNMPRGFLRWMMRFMRLLGRDPSKWGRNGDIDLRAIAGVEFPVHAVIDIRSVRSIKEQAAACHHSQGGGLVRGGMMGLFSRLFNTRETFMRGRPVAQPGEGRVNDLFTWSSTMEYGKRA